MNNSSYSWFAKNYGKDYIYSTRLRLFEKMNIDPLKSKNIFSYYQSANLGIILL